MDKQIPAAGGQGSSWWPIPSGVPRVAQMGLRAAAAGSIQRTSFDDVHIGDPWRVQHGNGYFTENWDSLQGRRLQERPEWNLDKPLPDRQRVFRSTLKGGGGGGSLAMSIKPDPDDASSVCEPLVPTLSKGPEVAQIQSVPNAQGSYRPNLIV
jgi:hypothetical protein